MPSKTASKRELVEPHTGDKRYVRRKADGTFGKTVDVGRSLSAGEIRPLPPRVETDASNRDGGDAAGRPLISSAQFGGKSRIA
jgi:hypothetical protein